MEKKVDLSDFECGDRQAGLSISQTGIFPTQLSLWFKELGLKWRKYEVKNMSS